jgi:hypothetical protein
MDDAKKLTKFEVGFVKKILGVLRFAANMAELELQSNSSRRKVLSTIVKYWFHLLCMDSLEIEKYAVNSKYVI